MSLSVSTSDCFGICLPFLVRFNHFSDFYCAYFCVFQVRYSLNNANELRIDYAAVTSRDTLVNLTNHSYFNLASPQNGVEAVEAAMNHEVVINATRFTPMTDAMVPTGEIRSVEATPFDFRKPHKIGSSFLLVDFAPKNPLVSSSFLIVINFVFRNSIHIRKILNCEPEIRIRRSSRKIGRCFVDFAQKFKISASLFNTFSTSFVNIFNCESKV